MDVKEQLGILWIKIKANVDRTAFVVFLILLIAMVGIYGYEMSKQPPEMPDISTGKFTQLIPNENYDKVMNYIRSETELDKNEKIRKIRDFNIFDYKYVRDRDELQKEADKKYERAAQLFSENKIDDSEKILKEILLTWPTHISAKELLDKIVKAKMPTPTPKPTAPAVPPMEGAVGLEPTPAAGQQPGEPHLI